MAQIFSPLANGITRLVLAGIGLVAVAVAIVWLVLPRSS